MSQAQSGTTVEAFHFPAFHSFAPAYTKQPVKSTLQKQTALWCDLTLDYCRHYNVLWLDIVKATNCSLFVNPSIAYVY